MGIEFRSNGRKVDLADWVDSQMKRVVDESVNDFERQIKQVRCRTHGRTPVVTRKRTANGFEFEVESCCEESAAQARQIVG